ncbi:MAG: small transmembrane and glycosylated protein [Actinomyces sp.]|nr:small transmembrane and glycosylated protein [Actinomyces sp.]
MSTPTPSLPENPAGSPIPPAGQVPAAPSPAVAAAMPTFTPLTAPRPRATGGQIAIAVITSVLVVLFAITTLVFAGIYSLKSSDLNKTQEELSTVQQELQEAQEGAK